MYHKDLIIPEPPQDTKYICVNPTNSKILITSSFSPVVFKRLKASTRMLSRIMNINEKLYSRCSELRDIVKSNYVSHDYDLTKIKYNSEYGYKSLLSNINYDYRTLKMGLSPKNKYSRDFELLYLNQVEKVNNVHKFKITKLKEQIEEIESRLEPHADLLLGLVEDPVNKLTYSLHEKIKEEESHLYRVYDKNEFMSFVKDAYLKRVEVFKVKYTYMMKMFKLESRLISYVKSIKAVNNMASFSNLFTVTTIEEKYLYCKFFLTHNNDYRTSFDFNNDIEYIKVKYKSEDEIEFKIKSETDKVLFIKDMYNFITENKVNNAKPIQGLISS